jgi:hypothetical protein
MQIRKVQVNKIRQAENPQKYVLVQEFNYYLRQ